MNLAFSCAVVAMLALLVAALASLAGNQYPSLLRKFVQPLIALAGLSVAVSGVMALYLGGVYTITLPLGLPWFHWHLRLDALSGFFLCLIGVVSFAVGVYAVSYVRSFEQNKDSQVQLGVATAIFHLGMILVVLADDALMFMVAWELMSLSSYFLVAFHHDQAANRSAAFIYLLMAHIAALAILLCFSVLAAFAGDFTFGAMRQVDVSGAWATLAIILALFGFGSKAGLMPLHVWLPEAHSVAPSHISALMSGVMLKVAVYGFVRVCFDLVGQLQWQWGVLILALGCLTALMGVLYALMQTDLKRVLAYSSVENIGIIFIGIGLSIIFYAADHANVGTLALVAALYHTFNHSLYKSLLFMGAGVVLHSAHERNLEQMGGLLRRIPWTGWFFLVGCLSISALPPFNGFVSEWLTFQATLQVWQLNSGVMRSVIPITAAVLALTGALTTACFVRLYGIAFLGQARSRHVRRARQAPKSMRAGQAILALLCIILGVFPTYVIGFINVLPRQLVGHELTQATASGWLWLTPISAQTASYGAPITAFTLLIVLVLGVWVFSRRRKRIRRCDPWDCGFAPPTPSMQYTATSFSQPIMRIFSKLFRIDENLDRNEAGIKRYSLLIQDHLWYWLYLPIGKVVDKSARQVTRLQSGHIRLYLGWSLATLLLLLWIVS